jgi:hypothetical protein
MSVPHIRSFSSNAPAEEAVPEKKKKPVKTWFQVYSDMEIREVTKPLAPSNDTKNSKGRYSERSKKMAALIYGDELMSHIAHCPDVYVRIFDLESPTKTVYELMPLEDAKAKAAELNFTLLAIKGQFGKLKKPDNMAKVKDDGIPALIMIDHAAWIAELRAADLASCKPVATKDVKVSPSTLTSDMLRKLGQAFDHMASGAQVRFLVQGRPNIALMRSVQESLGIKDEAELRARIEEAKAASAAKAAAAAEAADAKIKAHKALKSKTTREADRPKRERGGGEDGDGDSGDSGFGEEGAVAEAKRKLSKKDMEAQKERAKVDLMDKKDKLAHLASLEVFEKNTVLWDMVTLMHKIAAVVVYNRRMHNAGKPLGPELPEAPVVTSDMSKKVRQQTEVEIANIKAMSKDPLRGLKHEVATAIKQLEKDVNAYDADLFDEQSRKKNVIFYLDPATLARESCIATNSFIGRLR